jgi:cytochrome c oxidase accessory protein FixG
MNKMVSSAGLEPVDGPLYAPRKKVYPQSVSGTFRRIKWALMGVCLAVYYFLPFVRWDRGPTGPSQAVLIDFPSRRFYFFFIELWPQEVYYFTGLLILAALMLFLMNAVAGRIWCGYLCPQTVWTDLFYAVERFIEGDRRDRQKKDHQRLTVRRVGEIVAKHTIWLMIAWWTGGAWVLYFADAPTLVKDLATFQASYVAYLWIGILTLTTYTFAGHMREQVCTYMCPWPRIQAALTDEWALNVAYKYDRGEPRTSLKKAAQMREAGEVAGDCIDCDQCVAVCPTGIDIRDGAQLECIQCGLCIDACDTVMAKIGRPARLIGYESEVNLKRRIAGKPELTRIVRPRTILYAGLIVAICAIMLVTLLDRTFLAVNVLHDRNPVAVKLSDGSIRNGYTLHLLNKRGFQRTVAIDVDGPTGVQIHTVTLDSITPDRPMVTLERDATTEVRVVLTASSENLAASTPVRFRITDLGLGEIAMATDHFVNPQP